MNKNKKHYDWFGDPLPELRNALAMQIKTLIPEQRFKPKFKSLYNDSYFRCMADDVLRATPENITLSVNEEGSIAFSREEIKPDPHAALTGDALAEFTKDKGPETLQELLDRGIKHSSFNQFLQ